MNSPAATTEEYAFERVFAQAHAGHPTCLADEWLSAPCPGTNGPHHGRPVVWSRRNGPWHHVPILLVGAAPGNDGGRGRGSGGAHGTRIPFGGDIAGANLDVLLGSIGVSRNDVFITAAFNSLPLAGGGEPRLAEILRPVGSFESSLHLLQATMLACSARLVVALGNVAVRAVVAAAGSPAPRLPSLAALQRRGLIRGVPIPLRALLEGSLGTRTPKSAAPHTQLLWLTHPSAQNMSPFAARDTLFHTRMLEARSALRSAAAALLAMTPPARRPQSPRDGIYALPEWREVIAPRHERLDELWRQLGV